MDQSPFWETNSHPDSPKIPRLSWNPKVHNRVHKSPPLVPILNHMNPAHTLTPYFFKIRVNIYELDDRGSRVRFPAHHRVQNGSGAHPASYPMGTMGSFLGDKAAGAWSWPLASI
jgi:hypothetical protein